MELRHLRYFVAAAEEENFHRAAARLHIAQPALSKQIAQLEADLGCELFLRARGRIRLAAAGHIYLADARRILQEVERATERVRQAATGQLGTLRIGIRETAGRSSVVSRSFADFRSAFAQVELRLHQLTSPAQCAALRTGDLDAGFIYLSPGHDQGLARLPIATDHFYLALQRHHPLAKKRRVQLRDLVDEPFIWLARSRNAYYSDALLHECVAGGLTPKVIQEADSEATALNLVAVGMGAGFVVAPSPASPLPDVVLKPVAELNSRLTLALAWDPAHGTPLLERFVDTVRATLAAAPFPP